MKIEIEQTSNDAVPITVTKPSIDEDFDDPHLDDPRINDNLGEPPILHIEVKIPEDQQDTPGVLFSTLLADGGVVRGADGRIHLYERR